MDPLPKKKKNEKTRKENWRPTRKQGKKKDSPNHLSFLLFFFNGPHQFKSRSVILNL
jgi:hypothetical protein